MKKLQFLLIAVLFFSIGFLLSKRIYTHNRIQYMTAHVNGSGLDYDLRQTEDYNSLTYWTFVHNRQMKKCYQLGGDSSFNAYISNEFLIGPMVGGVRIVTKLYSDSSYYECIFHNEGINKKKYDFDNLYLLTPDTVYHLIPEPIILTVDTIKRDKGIGGRI